MPDTDTDHDHEADEHDEHDDDESVLLTETTDGSVLPPDDESDELDESDEDDEALDIEDLDDSDTDDDLDTDDTDDDEFDGGIHRDTDRELDVDEDDTGEGFDTTHEDVATASGFEPATVDTGIDPYADSEIDAEDDEPIVEPETDLVGDPDDDVVDEPDVFAEPDVVDAAEVSELDTSTEPGDDVVPETDPYDTGAVERLGLDRPVDPGTGSFEDRWGSIQAGFIDDPQGAVEDASLLLTEMWAEVERAIKDQRQGVDGRWQGTECSTDDLRTVMQRYRDLYTRLLDISAA
jgi:hypothetical protein